MSTLPIEIERLMMGANVSLDLDPTPKPEWLAGKLSEIFARYESTKNGVTVSVSRRAGTPPEDPPNAVEIERSGGVLRKLVVANDGRRWELADTVNASTPGQIAGILSKI